MILDNIEHQSKDWYYRTVAFDSIESELLDITRAPLTKN
jgi:hypothetical protein